MSPELRRRTSAPVTADLFDRRLRAQRRDRAARTGPDLFLFDRAFDECLERLADIGRRFDRCLLIGCPSPEWPARLRDFSADAEIFDPGPLFAAAAQGRAIEEDRFDFGEQRYDLALAVGTLDSVNELPLALKLIHRALKPDCPLVGAFAGGNSLPSLRSCLIEAGRAAGRAVARAHPRIEAPTLAGLLSTAGFAMTVVDIDRVILRYSALADLVQDLRSMGATSVLADRAPPLTRKEFELARTSFARMGSGGRTEEQVEILHFLGWRQ